MKVSLTCEFGASWGYHGGRRVDEPLLLLLLLKVSLLTIILRNKFEVISASIAKPERFYIRFYLLRTSSTISLT